MESLKAEVPTGLVFGEYDGRFASVVERFVDNFEDYDEVGASLCVTHEGETVIDVWGGAVDRELSAAWEADTISIVMSCTKGAVALCAHVLASQGLLDIEAPVAQYWPEFACNGKEGATVRMMLDHSVGVPAIRGELPGDFMIHWDQVVDRIAAEEPFWEPGTRNGYHLVNFGWTVGEIVRRASGKSLGTFFQDAIARPLGLDFWIGLPEELEPRMSNMIQSPPPDTGGHVSRFMQVVMTQPESATRHAMANLISQTTQGRAWHAAEIGGGGGITNARGLAGMYTPLALGGGGIVDPATLDRARRCSTATNLDAVLQIATRFGLGFMLSMDNRDKYDTDSVVIGDHAFGHVGMGGSIGFADPSIGLAMGYTMNRMGPGILLNERGQGLVDATCAAVAPRA
ncbi:MAG TPA: serine hydrolase domain-containing protein [Acidimicrobiales bacterium]|nr:serine hydrolase domain-containing protein [Acidimicrobiales bacterium]